MRRNLDDIIGSTWVAKDGSRTVEIIDVSRGMWTLAARTCDTGRTRRIGMQELLARYTMTQTRGK